MTVVSSKEFVINEDKYFDLAMDEQVFVKKGENMFILTLSNKHNSEDIIFQPDDDFYRSISADEFRKRLVVVLEKVDKQYANKCK